MPLKEAGYYMGQVKAAKVDRSKNGALQFIATCELTQFKQDGKWIDIPPVAHTAYLSLTKTTGERIGAQIGNLMEAFGWDGKYLRDLLGPQDKDGQFRAGCFAGKTVNVTVDEDEYDGKRVLKIAWINAAGNGLKPLAAGALDDLERQWLGMESKQAAAAPKDDCPV